MKKVFSLIIALICAMACICSFTACGSGNTDNTGNNGNTDGDNQVIAVQTVTLNKSTLALKVGGTETLTVTVKPDNATNKAVDWSSDKPEIATVQNGKVTAMAEGTATITAACGGKSDTCTVTVSSANLPSDTDKTLVEAVKLNKSDLTLDIDGTETLYATVTPENATDKSVNWTSDKPEIATVQNGKVTAMSAGTAKITATADGKSDVCTVTVNKPQPQNPYANVVKAIQQVRSSTVLLLYINEKGKLCCYDLKNENVCSVKFDIEIDYDAVSTLKNVQNIDNNLIANANVTEEVLWNVNNTTSSMTHAINVQSVIEKYADNGYEVIFGTFSQPKYEILDVYQDGKYYGANINAILVKDEKVYIYSNKLLGNSQYHILEASNFDEEENLSTICDVAHSCYFLNSINNENYNKYSELTAMLEEKVNYNVLVVYSNSNGRLGAYGINAGALRSSLAQIKLDTENLIESAKAITKEEILSARFSNSTVCYAHNRMTTFTNSEMVQSLIAKLIGSDYNIIYGSVERISSNSRWPTRKKDLSPNTSGYTGTLGYGVRFNVDALLEKDGEIFKYSTEVSVAYVETVSAYGEAVYNMVLNGGYDDKFANWIDDYSIDYSYYTADDTLINLGVLAKDYWAECNK